MNANLNAGLFVEPKIMGCPRLRRVSQAKVELLQSQWNKLVYLAERDLNRSQQVSTS